MRLFPRRHSGRNDEVVEVKFFLQNDARGLSKARGLPGCIYFLVVIPAKAGIQEGDAGAVNKFRLLQ